MVGQGSGITPEFILYPGERTSFEIAIGGPSGQLVIPAEAVRYITLYVIGASTYDCTDVQLLGQITCPSGPSTAQTQPDVNLTADEAVSE